MVYFKPVRDDAGPAVPAIEQYSGPSPVLKAISYTLLLFLIHPIFSNHIFLLSCIFFSTFIWKTCFSGEKILLVKCHIMWENEHRCAVIILTKASGLNKRTCLFLQTQPIIQVSLKGVLTHDLFTGSRRNVQSCTGRSSWRCSNPRRSKMGKIKGDQRHFRSDTRV